MKITFFDTLPHEEEFLKDRLPEGTEAVFINESIHPSIKTPEIALD